jgi:hypothetical protein
MTCILLILVFVFTTASATAAEAASWNALGKLLQSIGSASQEAKPPLLVQALQMRKQLPPMEQTPSGTEEPGSPAEINLVLNLQVLLTAEGFKSAKRYQDALSLFESHLSDSEHSSPVLRVGDYCSIAECHMMLGNTAQQSKACAEAFATLDRSRGKLSAKDWEMAVGRLGMYKAFLIMQKKDQQVAAIAKKLAAYTRQ